MPIRQSVLVIDDDPVFRGFCRDLLEAEGFRVVEASNGAEALIWFERERANIILLELQMPILDGRNFLEYRLGSPELWAIPVVVVTRQRVETDFHETLHRLGATRLLGKPVAPEDLLGAVRGVLGEPRRILPPTEAEVASGRRDPRVMLTVPVRVRTKGLLETTGRLWDLSAGGLGAYLPDRLTHGERITLSLDIQGRLFLEGVVQWAGDILTAMGYRHGMRFAQRQQKAFPLHLYALVRESPEASA
ncbi:MAG: response regulator [Candidatus Methylomirabilales bacterium]